MSMNLWKIEQLCKENFALGAASRDAEITKWIERVNSWTRDCERLADERDQLREQVKMLRCERDAARYKQERTVRILTGIHALLYPPRFTDSEGRMWQLKSPIVEEQMQKLSDKIRTIPDEIEALRAHDEKLLAQYQRQAGLEE